MKTTPMIGTKVAMDCCAVRWISMVNTIPTGTSADKIGQFAWTGEKNSTMARESLNDLFAFLAVARDRSFTKGAAKLRGIPLSVESYPSGLGGKTWHSVAYPDNTRRLVDVRGRTLIQLRGA